MTNIRTSRNCYGREKNEKLNNKDFFRRLIQEVLDKMENTGVTVWTFGVEHNKLEKNTVQYKKMQKSQIL
jgi:hypothetical protein